MERVNVEGLGMQVRAARESKRISQLELALQSGVSQRHLSFVETGKSTPSRDLLHTLMEALDLPLAARNALLMRAGYAPVYGQRALESEAMAPVRTALESLLEAHAPSPAMVLDAHWNLIMANRGLYALAHALPCRGRAG